MTQWKKYSNFTVSFKIHHNGSNSPGRIWFLIKPLHSSTSWLSCVATMLHDCRGTICIQSTMVVPSLVWQYPTLTQLYDVIPLSSIISSLPWTPSPNPISSSNDANYASRPTSSIKSFLVPATGLHLFFWTFTAFGLCLIFRLFCLLV